MQKQANSSSYLQTAFDPGLVNLSLYYIKMFHHTVKTEKRMRRGKEEEEREIVDSGKTGRRDAGLPLAADQCRIKPHGAC